MDDLVGSHPRSLGLRRSVTERAARALLPIAALAVLTSSCGSPSADATSALVAEFGTADGMLAPPELWGALDISTNARIQRHVALQAIGADTASLPDVAALYESLRVEFTDDLAAAAVLQDAGLLGSDVSAPWSAADVTSWIDSALEARSIDRLWLAFTLPGAPELLAAPDATTVGWLVEAAGSAEIVPAKQATAMLRTLAPEALTTVAVPAASEIRGPLDAAWLLYDAAVNASTALSDVDDLAIETAAGAITTDDRVYSLVVRAYVADGDIETATAFADRFDTRRLLPSGDVLEPVVFAGTAGSTFRMLRYEELDGDLATELTDAERRGLREQALADLSIDVSHRLAGLSSAVLLDADSVPPSEREVTIAAALTELVPVSGPLDFDAAIGWLAVAEAALVLDVPIMFPGFSADALATWTSESPETVAPLLARFLEVVATTGPADAPGVAELTDLLASTLATQPVAELDSSTLFAGSLAVRELSGDWVVPPALLLETIRTRSGDCLGGFDDYVREAAEPATACNVDATRYATLLATRITEDTQ